MQLVEALTINKLEQIKANNKTLQANLFEAIATRDRCNVKISQLTNMHECKCSALAHVHARSLAGLRDAHAMDLAEQHTMIKAVEKQKYATCLSCYFGDIGALTNSNNNLTVQIAALKAQFDAAQQAALLQTMQIVVIRLWHTSTDSSND